MNQNPDLNIMILPSGDTYTAYAFPIDGRTVPFILPLDRFQLCHFINKINDTLLDIVNRPEYSKKIEIPASLCEEDLCKLASLKIIENIFLGSNPSKNAETCVDEIKRISSEGQKIIQIVAEKFWIPWPLLYDGHASGLGQKVDREGFWGFKHIIDTPPMVNNGWRFGCDMSSSKLVFGLNVNDRIDSVFQSTYVKDQTTFFQGMKKALQLELRNYAKDILAAFGSSKNFEDTVSYYFCHANCPSACDLNSSLDDYYLEMTDIMDLLTLGALRNGTFGVNFINEPLVFINACDSTKMSPLFYDGFVPFFFDKKARAIVGTLSKIPAIFAYKFSLEFFKKFFEGQMIGSVIRDLRIKFMEDHNNLLGLFYTSYCYSKIRLQPPLLSSTNKL